MSRFVIRGGKPLFGEVTVGGNKNAALPMLAACLLTEDEVTLENVPAIRDVAAMLEILTVLGVQVRREGARVHLCARNVATSTIPRELCERVRTSFLLVAPLLARCGHAKLFPPGGDAIGRRRLDAHFYGLRTLGAEVNEEELEFRLKGTFTGRVLFFDEASVTATEHILMAAALATGETTILNAACEPHVQDLAKMLRKMGAHVRGIGTNTLTIEGVPKLKGCKHRIESDHIEAGSYLALVAATGGEVVIHETVKSHYWMIRRVFERFSLELELEKDFVRLKGGQRPRVVRDIGGAMPRVDDGPWPQFPSDLMSAMLVLATQAEGTVLFFEKMFESRMYFVDPLIQMGANAIVCDPHRVVVSGPAKLQGATVRSPDIRAGMALLIAALCATRRPSVVHAVEIIDRGYENIDAKLRALGADIVRESD